MNQDPTKLGKEIQKSFLNLLHGYLPRNLLENVKENKTLKIASIACGRFLEAECLFDYFSPYKKSIKLYGIEISEELLNVAKKRLLESDKKDFVFFKCDNASEAKNYEEWTKDGLFDLFIVRHPEITFNTDAFMKIFSNCKNLLKKGGHIFVTTHHENEKRAVDFLLKMLNFNMVVEAENKNSASLKKGEELVFSDKFLLIGVR